MIVGMAALANAHDTTDKVVAPTKYGIFREDCFESFFTRFDFFSDPSCIKFSFSKLIGFLIVGGSVFFKLP